MNTVSVSGVKGETMPRYIDADALKDDIAVLFERNEKLIDEWLANCVDDVIDEQPTADVVERKRGKWTEKEVIYADEAKTAIEEWQSCRCSVCGKYDTRPYMYYFHEPHFCSWCGAEMRKETEDA